MNPLIQSLFSFALVAQLIFVPNLSFSQFNLDSGLVGYFKLDGNVADSSTLALHGTATSVTNTSGIHNLNNTGMSFNGTNSKVIGGTQSRSITDVVSVSAWVKTTVTTGNIFLVEKYRWQQDKGFFLSINWGIPAMTARNTSNGGAHTWNSSQTFSISDGTWHHLLGVVNQNSIEIWVDGILRSTGSLSATNPDLTTTTDLGLGYNVYGNSNYFTGSLDEVRIYNRILSPYEIDSLSTEKYTFKTNNTVVCDSLVSPSGNYVWNTSGQYTDTLVGTTSSDTIFTVNLTLTNPNTTVTQIGNTLYAVSNSNYSYQWIDCINGNSLIAGAQDSIFTPTQNGAFAVIITNGNCVDTSSCTSITGIPPALPIVNSIFLDGISNYIEVANHSSINVSNGLTLEASIKPCTVVGHKMIMSKLWCSGNQNSYYFSVKNGKLRFVWFQGGCSSTGSVYESNSMVITANTWQHVAVVHTSTSVMLFVNGVLVPSSLIQGTYSSLRSSNQPIRIGT